MTGKKLQRLLACLLAVLLLSQVGAFLPAARAAGGYTLQNGSAIIKPGMSDAEVNRALTRALVVGFDQKSEADQNALLDSLQWEYKCEGKGKVFGVPATHTDWGTINGFTSVDKRVKYTHPALVNNADGGYWVRVKGGSGQEVRLEKRTGLASSISLKSGVSVALTYNADGSLNFDALRAAILEQVVASSTPKLTVNDVTIEYYAKSELVSHKEWVKLEGDRINLAKYPAISAGEQKIRISFYGNNQYTGSSAEANVTFVDRADAHIVLREGQTVNLQYTEAVTIDFDALRTSILAQVVDPDSVPALTLQNTEIKYYADSKTTGITHEWVKLEGDRVNLVDYPAISAGQQKIQKHYNGD